MRFLSVLASAGSMIAALPLYAVAQTAVANAPDPFVHAPTTMAFPERLAGAVRHQVMQYTSDGADIGIGYQIVRDGRMIAYLSIFVYPAPLVKPDSLEQRSRACRGISDGIKRDILSHEPSAKMTGEEEVSAPFPTAIRGLRITFSGGNTPFDGSKQNVRERNDLFCFAGGKWLIAYRSTTLDGFDASADIERIEKAIPWPDRLLEQYETGAGR